MIYSLRDKSWWWRWCCGRFMSCQLVHVYTNTTILVWSYLNYAPRLPKRILRLVRTCCRYKQWSISNHTSASRSSLHTRYITRYHSHISITHFTVYHIPPIICTPGHRMQIRDYEYRRWNNVKCFRVMKSATNIMHLCFHFQIFIIIMRCDSLNIFYSLRWSGTQIIFNDDKCDNDPDLINYFKQFQILKQPYNQFWL